MRRFLLLAVLVSALVRAAGAHAQFSIYGTFAPVRISNVATGNNPGQNAGYSTSTYWAQGFGAGVTVNFLPLPVVSLGLDLRGSSRPGTQGADLALAGLKLGAKIPLLHIKPYIEAAGGYAGTRARVTTGAAAGSTVSDHFAAYEVLGGLDYPLVHFVDLRLIEVGGGKGTYLSGPNNDIPNISLFTVNTGVVIHF